MLQEIKAEQAPYFTNRNFVIIVNFNKQKRALRPRFK